jgi:hypothetical protein
MNDEERRKLRQQLSDAIMRGDPAECEAAQRLLMDRLRATVPDAGYLDVTAELEVWFAGLRVIEFERLIRVLEDASLYDLHDIMVKLNGPSIEPLLVYLDREKLYRQENPRIEDMERGQAP